MAYTDSEESISGDQYGSDGVNRDNGYFDQAETGGDDSIKELVAELNAILVEPRYENDICVTLTMPVAMLKKARDKINLAIYKVYERHKSPTFHIFDVLVALESMVDAPVISSLVDMDIKRIIAADRGIVITDQQLEDVASGKSIRDTKESGTDESGILNCPKCGGTGDAPGGGVCPICMGKGLVCDGDDISADDIDLDDLGNMDEIEGLDDVVLDMEDF